jgi:SWIM/SEC-C metal-binding protein
MDKLFDGKKPAQLGSPKRPAQLRVQTDERGQELSALCAQNGWACNVTIDPDQPEEITDLELLQNPVTPVVAGAKTGRNAPCPCGSGKKYKKCCGRQIE